MEKQTLKAMQILSLLKVKLKNKQEEVEKLEKVGEFNKLDAGFQINFLCRQSEYSELKKLHDEIEALMKDGLLSE